MLLFQMVPQAALLASQVWAEGATYDEVLEELKTNKINLFRSWVNDDRPWAFKVGAFRKSLSSEYQRKRMNFFASLFKGS